MSVVENRSNSALFKRAEQLKRWEESETNRELTAPKIKSRRIQFSLECVFLAACASGDKDEVLRLLSIGADIDTSNVDGLSALHQACIDDNLDMVEFLIEHGADINKGDNEGWTPLHATASCGFISIAKYLIEHGADVASVNNDGELAVDIAESDEMEDLLHAVLKERGIDSDEARNKEERLMLQHAKEWLNSGKFEDIPHEKTGATALHVAASKGYIKVMDTLIQAGADVNAQDFDGWTPLHAAAHWGQKEACEILVENFCDMDLKNYVGQSAFDVSEGEMTRLLEDLKKKRVSLQKERSEKNVIKGMPWLNNTDKLDVLLKDKDSTLKRQSYGQFIMEEDVCPMDKVPKVELKIETEFADTKMRTNIADENNKYIHLNDDEKQKIPRLPDTINKVPINSVPSTSPPKSVNENEDSRVPSWRKTVSLRNVIRPPFKFDEDKQWTSASNDQVNINSDDKTPEVALRRTQSFEADDKFYRRYCELKAKIESGNARPALISPANNTASLPMRSASLKEKYNRKALLMHEDVLPSSPTLTPSSASTTASPAQPFQDTSAAILLPPKSTSVRNGVKSAVNAAEATTVSAPTTPIASKLSPGNIFKNFFKSFVPPVRDEESETQRKAHAKRVRETRRSTQGVTLEELKSAEQLVKKKQQQQQLQQATSQLHSSSPIVEQPKSTDPRKQTWSSREPANISVSATIHTGTTTVPLSNKSAATNERRPSWRLRIDNGCKFMLEDARSSDKDIESPNDVASPGWPGSQTLSEPPTPDTANVTLPFRKNNNNLFTEELDQQTKSDKEKNFSLTQPVNPRRKRSKRRSTGAVQIDAEELNERLNSENEVNDIDNVESGGTDRSGRTSRLGSTSSLGDNESSSRPTTPGLPNENGVLDYKKLYEETLSENELLRSKLKKAEDELTQCKSRLTDPPAPVINKNSLSELEKREKRAMERKLSEMEEELKNTEQIKQENQRLKDENGALIRVISKLSK